MPRASTGEPHYIRRLVIWAFGALCVVTISMCAMLLNEVRVVSAHVTRMRDEEVAVRQSFQLAAAAREQYIHMAHGIVAGDRSHVDHYATWRERVRTGIEKLEPLTPEAERWRLHALEAASAEAHHRYMTSLLPALDDGQDQRVRDDHEQIQRLTQAAAEHSDAIARAIEDEMASTHDLAMAVTSRSTKMAATCIAVVVLLSVFFARRLHAAILVPLRVLLEATRSFAGGSDETRVGALGRGELRELAEAFDTMAVELASRQGRLVQSQRMAAVGQLAAGVAHELNNPIGVIRGYLKTMHPTQDQDALLEELQILDEEAAHCQRLAEDLLSYARPTDLRVAAVDMAKLLHQVGDRTEAGQRELNAELTIEAAPCTLAGDALRLRQVFFNVVLNALQASPAGEPVSILGRNTGSNYEVVVSDRGVGIAEEDRDTIFEPFFSKRSGGTGLGLAVAQGLVRAHGGRIFARERDGGGTEMVVTLPIVEARG